MELDGYLFFGFGALVIGFMITMAIVSFFKKPTEAIKRFNERHMRRAGSPTHSQFEELITEIKELKNKGDKPDEKSIEKLTAEIAELKAQMNRS